MPLSQSRRHRESLETGRAFENSKPTSSAAAPPTRPHLLIFPKQPHHLRTSYRNIRAYGRDSHPNHHNDATNCTMSLSLTMTSSTYQSCDSIILYMTSLFLHHVQHIIFPMPLPHMTSSSSQLIPGEDLLHGLQSVNKHLTD